MKKALLLFCVFFIYASANVYVRVAHTSVKAPAVDVKVNGTVIFSDLSYPTVTSYLKVNPGFYQIEIFTHGQNTQLFNATVSLYDLQTYTFVATGDPAKGEFTILRYADDTSNPADEYTSRIRILHGIADVPVAEVLVDGVVVAQLNYEDASGYLNVAGGSHLIVINQKIGTVSSKVFSTNLNFNGGTVYTLFAEGLLNNSAVNDIAVAPISDAIYQYCSARAAHASPDAPAVDIFLVDLTDSVSTKVIPNLAFTQFSNYRTIAFVPTKNYTVVLTPVDKPNDVVYSTFVVLRQDTVVTATAVGLIANGTTTPFHLTFTFDSIDAPKDPLTASIQFFHAVPGALPATLLLDKVPLFPVISYDTTSDYVLVKRGSYTLSLFINGSTIVSKPIDVAGGAIYSVYAEGFVTNPSLQISTDASYSYTVVRASHASPESPAVNLVLRDVHNTEFYKVNVAYGSTTAYTTIVSQAYTASLEVDTSSIYSNAVTLAQDTTNTLVVFGTLNQNFTDGLTIVAVQDTNDAPGDSKTARVRFVHAVVGGPAVDVFFNDAREFPNSVPYKGVTGYENVAEGTYKVEVKSGALSLISFSYYFMGGAVYTIFAEGEAGAQSKVPVKAVVNQDAAYQYTTFRAVHASADAPAVDIYLDNGVTSSAVFTNLAYGSKTDYKEIVLYNYTFQVVPTGTKNAVLSTWAQFTVDTTWTAAILGLTKANTTTGLSVSFYEDDTSAPSNSLSARARFVHAVADGAPNVDVYFNDQIKFTKVAYKTATDYINVDAKTYRIDVYVSGTHQKLASVDNVAVSGGQVVTLFAEGTPAAITSKVFVDFTVDYFQLRVAYTSPDAGAVNVLVEGVTTWTNVQFGEITSFVEFTSDKKNVSLVQVGNNVILQSNTPFTKNVFNTLLVVGLNEKNTTTPLEAVIVLNQPPVPSSSAVAGVRITHASPNTPAVNIQFNGTVQFSNVDYKTTTQYKELTAGNYLVEANTTAGFIRANVSLHGGFAYTVFLEGLFPGVIVVPSVDYFPSPDARVRFLHTSPNTGAVDFLVNGSADIRNVEFAKNSNYINKHPGETDFNVVPTGLLQPDLIDASLVLAQQTDYSFFFVGLSENNATNTTSTLNHFILLDDNTLPTGGLVKVRFVHTSPDAPEVDVKVNGVPVFSNVTYKGFTKYVSLTADFVDLDVVLAGKTDNLLSSRLDLRVASGSAVYTLVAEGFAHKDPALRIVSILDAGNAPPVAPTGSGSGLNGVVIGLIIGGVAVAVIIIAGIVFVLYKKKKARSGYSEIPSQQ